ncbi:MAG TPA: PPOX class F420-dependent oxidoreductase [Acidimicrobiales bacterium]|nr:PPOX class F420-dependent oxidoreductase [Acidimicrobiales bacterium]
MDTDTALDFVATHHHAVLATRRRDGGTQLSPITVALNEQRHVVISTRETAVKTANLRREPRATLCVLQDAFFGGFVQLEGEATVHSLPEAMPGLVAYYRAAAGEHPDWAEYEESMAHERRVLIEIVVDRVGPNVSG